MTRRHLLLLAPLGLVLLWPAAAPAYTIMTSSTTGRELKWANWPMKWSQDKRTLPGVSWAKFNTAVKQSYATWQNVSCAYATFSYQGKVNLPSGSRTDRINTIYVPSKWNAAYSSALAVTRTSYDPSAAIILDADIMFNNTRTWAVNGAVGAIDVQAVATHEIGHQLGLNHSPISAATMYYATGAGNIGPRSLHSDDIAGVCYQYPNGKPKPPECTSNAHCAPGELCQKNKCVPGTATKGYGAPCTSPTECKSGLCVTTGGSAAFCSQRCDSTPCPNKDRCVNLTSGGKACLPGTSTQGAIKLGQPCNTDLDCKSQICFPVTGKGYICTKKCNIKTDDCPTGYYCVKTALANLCFPGSPPTKKKVGEACGGSSECETGLCGPSDGKNVCLQWCDLSKNDCPAGFLCVPVTGQTRGACVKDTTPKKKVGEACEKNVECDSGLCTYSGGNKICVQGCDPKQITCPAGLKCLLVPGTTRYGCYNPGDPSKGKLGAPCQGAADCASGLCATDPATGKKFCSELCDPNVGCVTGYVCAPAGGNQYACTPGALPARGGCGYGLAAPRPPGGWLSLLSLLPLLVLPLRRRRRG
jgi:Cys-rich repeat protein